MCNRTRFLTQLFDCAKLTLEISRNKICAVEYDLEKLLKIKFSNEKLKEQTNLKIVMALNTYFIKLNSSVIQQCIWILQMFV